MLCSVLLAAEHFHFKLPVFLYFFRQDCTVSPYGFRRLQNQPAIRSSAAILIPDYIPEHRSCFCTAAAHVYVRTAVQSPYLPKNRTSFCFLPRQVMLLSPLQANTDARAMQTVLLRCPQSAYNQRASETEAPSGLLRCRSCPCMLLFRSEEHTSE